jgi:hypothetical protein
MFNRYRNFDAREEYGFKPENVFAQFDPVNHEEIMEYLNDQAEQHGVFDLGPDDSEEADEILRHIWDTHLNDGPEWLSID